MKFRTLGESDLRVSPIGLGCWQFSKGKGLSGKYWPALADDVVREVVKASLYGGVNWFDTAEMYGRGESEKVLAASLSSLGKASGDIVIATKWWPAFRSARSIISTIDERLACLGGFAIDLYQVHQPFGFSSVEKEIDAMARLVDRSQIRNVGVSNFNAKRMRRADQQLRLHGLRLPSNQVRYSLLDRRIESNGVLETARELGVAIIAYSPLAQGILSGKFHENPESARRLKGVRKYLPDFSQGGLERYRHLIDVLKEIAQAHQARAAQVALNWLVTFHGESVVAIPGASSPAQARENAASMNLELSEDELRVIDEASKGR